MRHPDEAPLRAFEQLIPFHAITQDVTTDTQEACGLHLILPGAFEGFGDQQAFSGGKHVSRLLVKDHIKCYG